MFSVSSETTNPNPSEDVSFTFEVDDVPPKQKIHNLVDFNSVFHELVDPFTFFTHSSHKNDDTKKFVEVNYRMTGAVKAIHAAYMGHYNLKLSVSDFILLIGHGLSSHMEVHAKELRHHFVDFEGKERITIATLCPDWPAIVEQFGLEIKKKVKTNFYDVIIDDTSVATKLSKMASEVAIMDTFKEYFEYEAELICGIPKITLLGSKDDWERLRSKVKKLQELNTGDKLKLGWWLEHLVPLVDNIVDQAVSRKIDTQFWKNIYKFQEGRGCISDPQLDGWITKFIPYLDNNNKFKKNLFDKEIHPSVIPTGVSKVPFILTIDGKSEDMILYGGFIGAQMADEDTIEPAYFYGVGDDPKDLKEEIENICVSKENGSEHVPQQTPSKEKAKAKGSSPCNLW